jgi:hypothetical protein
MNTFPQAGILMALNAEKAEAIVMIPLFNMETDWCPVAKNLLYEQTIEESGITSDNPVFYSDKEKTSVVTSAAVGEETKRNITMQKYGSLQTGDEVLVIFLNGDIHQPVVAGRL